MASFNDKEMALARVYSSAMLELAEARGEADALRDELLDLAAHVETDAGFSAFVSSPMVDAVDRERSLDRLFRGRYSDLFVDSLQVLGRKGRLGLLGAVAETYRRAHEELRRRVEAHVRTASPLNDDLRTKLESVIAKHTGREVDLVETVDEDLLGGIVVHIGDEKFDMSVATQLGALGKALMDRASREIHSGRTFVEFPSRGL